MSIQFENTNVYGFEAAIRGMRNPMNSWNKSDSWICPNYDYGCSDCKQNDKKMCYDGFLVGRNDLELMKKLVKAGSDHRKFMRMIVVSVDIVAPIYWWKEFDTYKIGTVATSTSTMHKIHSREIRLNDFSMEHLVGRSIDALQFVVDIINMERERYLESNDKERWWQMIQLLPSSYNQRRTVMLNYEVLRKIYHARSEHKLDEWRDMCEWIETLPYKELVI